MKIKSSKVLAGFCTMSLLATSGINVYAESNGNDSDENMLINSFSLSYNNTSEDLKKNLKKASLSNQVENLSLNQRKEVIDEIKDSVSEETLNDYKIEMREEANSRITSTLSNLKVGEKSNQTLSDGTEIEIGSSDISEETDNKGGFSTKAVQPGNTVEETKKYGSRRYTAWVKLKSFGVTIATLKLVNHYSIGTYGLKLNSVDATGTNSFNTFSSVKVEKLSMPDRYAKKVGEDINGKGVYTINGYLNGGYVSITSTIKLISHDKTSKKARVYQTLKFES
ncbi:hypothetical protein [Exiguobacterium antarcticum]|uniref:hypothetical protein n=1 Tax=Exiguobacterium antarcticum TaxID=132920 RepID=UPI00047DB68C|nr:hypothetical protein [Exiguobacterium antarcticum]